MLNELLRAVSSGTKRNTSRWQRLLDDLHRRYQLYRDRFADVTTVSSGAAVLLRQILMDLVQYRDRETDKDYDQYLKVLIPRADGLSRLFDPTNTRRVFYNTFIINRNRSRVTEEFLISVRYGSIFDLPMGEGWEAWSKHQAVTLLHHPSPELSTDLFASAAMFERDLPDYAFIAINIPLLGMQFFKYIESDAKNLPVRDAMFIEHAIETFIHDWVMVKLQDDLERIWATNLLLATLDYYRTSGIEGITSVGAKFNPKEFGLSSVNEGIKALGEELQYVVKGRCDLEEFLYSDWLGKDHSLYKWMTYLNQKMDFDSGSQNYYLKFCIELTYIELLVNLISLNPTITAAQQVTRKIEYYMANYERLRIWKQIPVGTVQTTMEGKFTSLLERLRQNPRG